MFQNLEIRSNYLSQDMSFIIVCTVLVSMSMASIKIEKILCATILTTLSNILNNKISTKVVSLLSSKKWQFTCFFFSDKYLLPTFLGYWPRSYGGLKDEISMFPARAVKCAESLSRVWLFATSWTVACQGPLPMGFSRQEYWSGLPSPSPGDLTDTDLTHISCISCTGRWILYQWGTLEVP